MRYVQCNLSDLRIEKEEIYLNMGYREKTPEDSIVEQIENTWAEIACLCVPQYLYAIYPGDRKGATQVEVAGRVFSTGKMIASYLEGMEQACLFVTTAGEEYDRYKKTLREKGELVSEFIADAIGSAVAEACVQRIQEELSERYPDLPHSYPYSPGYCGWKLKEQTLLFSLLPDTPCGVTLNSSFLMYPIKSVSGIVGLGENLRRREYGCAVCENINCYKRKENRI